MLKHLLIEHSDSPLLSLVEFVYPKFLDNMSNAYYFDYNAILCSTIESIDQVYEFILCLMPGEEVTY